VVYAVHENLFASFISALEHYTIILGVSTTTFGELFNHPGEFYNHFAPGFPIMDIRKENASLPQRTRWNFIQERTTMKTIDSNIQGVGFLVLALLIFSLQDIAVKWIGGDYSVIEIVVFRSVIALPATLVLFRFEGSRGRPTTQRHKLEYVRGFFYFLSFTTYMMGVAALPLAELSTIRNSAPLMITLLSVVWLGEKVGPRHWLALFVGFVGVLFIVRPGATTFNLGSIFALIATLFYALNTMLTRKLRTTDSSATMAYYSSLVYLVAAVILAPLPVVVGEMPDAHPSIAFLFRAWTMPGLLDLVIMSGLGLVWAGGMYYIARAYSMTQASVAAPFEYIALPISAMWGFFLWQEVPTLATWIGAFLTVGSGLYILSQQRKEQPVMVEGSTASGR
jgi:drug/metabolite transporter (DMT)-like permease